MHIVSGTIKALPLVGEVVTIFSPLNASETRKTAMILAVRKVLTLALFITVFATPGLLFLLTPLCITKFSIHLVACCHTAYKINKTQPQREFTKYWRSLTPLFLFEGAVYALSLNFCPPVVLAYEVLGMLLWFKQLHAYHNTASAAAAHT